MTCEIGVTWEQGAVDFLTGKCRPLDTNEAHLAMKYHFLGIAMEILSLEPKTKKPICEASSCWMNSDVFKQIDDVCDYVTLIHHQINKLSLKQEFFALIKRFVAINSWDQNNYVLLLHNASKEHRNGTKEHENAKRKISLLDWECDLSFYSAAPLLIS